MQKISNNELKKITGGGIGGWFIIGGIVVFLIGVIDGYVRPLACNN